MTIPVEIQEKIIDTYIRAEKLFNRSFDIPGITANLRGTTAGYYQYNPVSRSTTIKVNIPLYNSNKREYLDNVVPHEIAHHIDHAINGYTSHGNGWKGIMVKLGIEPKEYHNLDMSKVKNLHPYSCGCKDRIHYMSDIRHKRTQSNMRHYSCRLCGMRLRKKSN